MMHERSWTKTGHNSSTLSMWCLGELKLEILYNFTFGPTHLDLGTYPLCTKAPLNAHAGVPRDLIFWSESSPILPQNALRRDCKGKIALNESRVIT